MAKQVAYGEATVRDADGVLVSRATGTFLLHRPDPAPTTRSVPSARTPGPASATSAAAPPRMGRAVCFACRLIARRLGLALAPVVPAHLCPLPSPLYTVLLGFKESPVAEARLHFCTVVRTTRAGVPSRRRRSARDHGGRPDRCGGPRPVDAPARAAAPRPRRRPGGRCRRRVARGALGPGPAAPHQPSGRVAARGPHATGSGGLRGVATVPGRAPRGRSSCCSTTPTSAGPARRVPLPRCSGRAERTVIGPLGHVLRPDRIALHAEFLGRHAA